MIRDEIFEQVYNESFSIIYRMVYRLTGDSSVAEDICHEAFLKYYPRVEEIPDNKQALYWLLRVAKNMTYNFLKKKQREGKLLNKLYKEIPYKEQSEEGRFVDKEVAQEVRAKIEQLPYKLRVPLILREYEGLSYRDIAEVMNITENNVKIRIFRARNKLAELLSSGGSL
ncbi:RNA polymerase sigma factor [Spirochaetia bacterium 38H-sp]|uniref:RNA polymerase sigma factor n=1 Tax=Rarispira pelagica TaxID=3141764 RepID=A0ABU9UC50_9SPIR